MRIEKSKCVRTKAMKIIHRTVKRMDSPLASNRIVFNLVNMRDVAA